jgi:hypothetical protein
MTGTTETLAMSHHHAMICNGGDDDACKVRQISVLFPGMDRANARAVAKKGLDQLQLLTMVVFLNIDEYKQFSLQEKSRGIRMFFHASQSKRLKWWKRNISLLSKNGEEFAFKRKDDRHAAAHLKLWDDEKYSCYQHELEKWIQKPKSTTPTNYFEIPEVKRMYVLPPE